MPRVRADNGQWQCVSLEVVVLGSKQANIRPAAMSDGSPKKRDLPEKPDLGSFLDEVKHRVRAGI